MNLTPLELEENLLAISLTPPSPKTIVLVLLTGLQTPCLTGF